MQLSIDIMKNLSRLAAFLVYILSAYAGVQSNLCSDVNYREINDPRRSTAFVSSTTRLCDRSLKDNTWYRFVSEAGGEMATKAPKPNSCGATSPIWMNGSHPTVEEGTVYRTACATVIMSGAFRPCLFRHNIKVRNCSGFYIYQLKKLTRCSFYCAGSKLVNCSKDDEYCLKNRPPFITMPDRVYAYENSNIQLIVNATDPEGYWMDYSFNSSTMRNVALDATQEPALLNIFVTKSGRVTLTVTDSASYQTAHHTTNVVAVPRVCPIAGKCQNNITMSTELDDLRNYRCACEKPYTGKCCETGPCDRLPCFPGLKCTVTADGYTCEKCPSRFGGDGKTCKLLGKEDTVKVNAQFTIISGLKWNSALLNKTSFSYKQTTVEIVEEIIKVYKNRSEFVIVVDLTFKSSKGSVVAEFQIVFGEKMDDPLKPLRVKLERDGKLGSFDVKSLEEIPKPDVDGSSRKYFGLEKTDFIIVASLIAIISLVLFVMCGICIKRNRFNIIVLCMNSGQDDVVFANQNGGENTMAVPHRRKPARNQVMDIPLQSVGTSSVVASV